MTLDERLVQITPTPRQVKFQQTEFYAFVHFTVNTFTNREWGDGKESEQIFNPEKLSAEQWVRSVKAAGMRGLILTCKHHDGFCLWHSRYTKHTVEYSPFRRDIVRETADACKKHGIKFGVYLSPWDMNCPLYGTGKPYDEYFMNQLTELLTGYGEIFSVWLDGACGEGPNGKKQRYDWDAYYSVIRKLQPDACISVCGPDVRWCGNEAGYTREAEWSVVPERTRDTERIKENSQQEDSGEFRQRKICAWDADLGSRDILENEPKLCWYPAEVNTSIRPGWFWHENEDDKVRPLDELIRIYYNSVGANATFLLNIPPTKDGLFHENDVRRLEEIGEYLRRAFRENIAPEAEITAEGRRINSLVQADDYDSFYHAEGNTPVITAAFDKPQEIGHIILKENIFMSQRIERFTVEAGLGGEFREIFRGTVVGCKRIIPLENVTADTIRIKITDSRTQPTLSFIGIYRR